MSNDVLEYKFTDGRAMFYEAKPGPFSQLWTNPLYYWKEVDGSILHGSFQDLASARIHANAFFLAKYSNAPDNVIYADFRAKRWVKRTITQG